ncbi:MAG TPA: hypothetical protein PKE26_05195 [Kiritimatiellia bacterium]|nr:hypothetical protein [Kiritimatiellia bacterium]HMO98488.1 hypothetical protein [Kiritimatiellia bacterium]HMP95796.1 hypothetical protein [Kiritimatiellia bacterium]
MKTHDAHHMYGSDAARTDYAESCRLWPDPFIAPDVPSRDILHQFRVDPSTLPPDLAEQIVRSVNCRRALAQLAPDPVETFTPASANGGLPIESLNAIQRATASTGNQGVPTAEPMFDDKSRIAPGQLWTTSTEVKQFSDDRICTRWIYQPPSVLIVSRPLNVPGDDTICRAVAVSPADLWTEDMIDEDEIRLEGPNGSRWVAHLWLNYPVSTIQLSVCMGALDQTNHDRLLFGLQAHAEGLPLTPSEGGGVPLDPEWDVETLIERDRLISRCSWLSATADASWASHEARQERMNKVIPLPAQKAGEILQFHHPASRVVLCAPLMPASADDATVRLCRVILWNGDLDALPANIAGKPESNTKATDRSLHARLTSGIHESEGHVSAQWELVGDRRGLRGGSLFFLVEGDTNTVVGGGLLSTSGRIATLKEGEWGRLERYVHDPSELLLLIRSYRA